MFNFIFLLKGIILGFSIAAPVGPIGVLCIRRTMQYGRSSGLISGMGAACADMIFCAIAAFGVSAIADHIVNSTQWLKICGGLFMIYLALKIYISKPAFEKKERSRKGLLSDFFSTFFLTITNPMTILAFLAIFAALGLGDNEETIFTSTLLTWGVFLGSLVWWYLLSGGISLFRKKITDKTLLWLNRLAAIIIAVFGCLSLFL